jgi:hypothetical protein
MPVPAVLILLVIGAALVAYISGPLLAPRRPERLARHVPSVRELTAYTDLLAERNSIYSALVQLDADYRAGQLEQQDYVSIRQTLAAAAVEVLQQLDALPALGPAADDLIEAALQQQQAAQQ